MLKERPWSRYWPKYMPKELLVPEVPLYSLLTESAARSPENGCVTYQGRTLSYRELDDLSSRFAASLARLGLKRGDRVALFMPNIPQFVIAYFGILKAGGIAVACSPIYKERELEYQLKDSGSSIVVAAIDIVKGRDLFESLGACRGRLDLKHVIGASVTDYLPGIKKRLAGLAGVKKVRRPATLDFIELVSSSQPIEKLAEVEPTEDVALLQYTGGTTGVAKGAMLTHYNLYSNALMVSKALPLTENDVAISVLPLFHIYGMTATMNAPLSTGARVVLLPRFDVKEVLKTIQKERVTCFCGVPAMYVAVNNLPEISKFNLRTVRACISGGAPLPQAVRKRFMELTGGKLVEGYGLTECSPVTHCNPLEDGPIKDGSIGIPFPSTDAAIVDADDRTRFLPVGETGELAVRGPQVMKGYWERTDETKIVLQDGWLLTGDMARMDEEGYFFIVDRKKEMIDVAGFKVYPREVEEVLFEHPGVKEAAAVGMADAEKGEVVKAFVVLKSRGNDVSESEIIRFCEERLARYKIPKKVEFVNELPKTLVGKVLRRKLKEEGATARPS